MIRTTLDPDAPASCRYRAVDDDTYDGAPDSGSNITGSGPNPYEAVRELMDKLEDRP